jgi:hypothetical protein
MKKTIITISMALTAMIGYSQGTISTINLDTQLISTNGILTTGALTGTAGLYYFALLTESMTAFGVANSEPTALQLVSSWTFTGIYTTNIASAGRENGGANIPTSTGWAPGVTNSYVLVGWSANLGSSWATIANENETGWGTEQGSFGISSVGFGEAGGGPDSLPAFSLFGSAPTAAGTPILSGFDLYDVTIPEPGTLALATLGGASLLMFRRKK